MLSHSNFEKFRTDFYKGKWEGMRLGQAFMFNCREVIRPNPLLFYDPDNSRAEEYIRRHYVPKVVRTWEWVINSNHQPYMPDAEPVVVMVELLMSESYHQLHNLATDAHGAAMHPDRLIQVSAGERCSSIFMYSNAAPCNGDLFFCEVVE